MSYILEALANSEQARQQTAATPKYSLLPVIGEELPQRRRWPYALMGALLVNAVVLQVWLHPTLPGGMASSKEPAVPLLAETQLALETDIAPLARMEKPAADEKTPTPIPKQKPASHIRLGGIAQLPPVRQKKLPDLSVAGFIRDEGIGSMVIVNDRLVREGDEVSPGLMLEKISADGLIFNYNGRRFKR